MNQQFAQVIGQSEQQQSQKIGDENPFIYQNDPQIFLNNPTINPNTVGYPSSLFQTIMPQQQITQIKQRNFLNPLESLKEQAEEVSLLQDQRATKQVNAKNTYIKKISTLIKDSDDNLEALEKIEKKKMDQNKTMKKAKSSLLFQEQLQQIDIDDQESVLNENLSQFQEQDKDKQKLARNRESARNSRKRKKIYLELLENKVTQLSDFLQESKKICQANDNLWQNLQNQINYKNELNANKAILFQNLQTSLESNTSENNINTIIESLKKKFGTVNQEKLMLLDYCYKQICEQVLPMHMQYIMYAASSNKDIFNENNNEQQKDQEQKQKGEFPNIINSLNLTESQREKAFKIKKKLISEKNKLEGLLDRLHDAKELMKKELHSLDTTLESLRKEFKPSQISKFILNIEKAQYKELMKTNFNKFFREKNIEDNIDESDDQSDTDLYGFIKSDDNGNTLMVDINEAYDVYADAYEFLSKKRLLSKEQ